MSQVFFQINFVLKRSKKKKFLQNCQFNWAHFAGYSFVSIQAKLSGRIVRLTGLTIFLLNESFSFFFDGIFSSFGILALVWAVTIFLICFLYMSGSLFRCITWPEFLNLKAVKGAKCFSTQTKTSTYILKGIEVFVGVEKHLWDIGVKLVVVVVSSPVT